MTRTFMRGSPMTLRTWLICARRGFYAVLVFVAVSIALDPSHAQTHGTEIATDKQADSAEGTHQSDFDYLLGDWEFNAEIGQYGKMHGFWSAARLASGNQIMD